ncbi:hypothetical protein ACLOJK_017404 [Asimina triloba]
MHFVRVYADLGRPTSSLPAAASFARRTLRPYSHLPASPRPLHPCSPAASSRSAAPSFAAPSAPAPAAQLRHTLSTPAALLPCSPLSSSPSSPLLPSVVVSFISPAPLPTPPFRLLSLLPSSSLPSLFRLPSRHSRRPEMPPCHLPSPCSRLPSLSLPRLSPISLLFQRRRLTPPSRASAFPVAPSALILPDRRSGRQDLLYCNI